jgi:recombination protein RecR
MYQTSYEGVLQDLIDQLVRLPAVGPKGAQRIAYHLLEADREDVEALAVALLAVKDRLSVCEVCFNTAEGQLCRVCRDETRDPAVLCVVEEPKDVIAIERTREFTGRYHVLGGVLDPMRGIGPDQLHIKELFGRLGGRHGAGGHSGNRPEHRGRGDRRILGPAVGHDRRGCDTFGQWVADGR